MWQIRFSFNMCIIYISLEFIYMRNGAVSKKENEGDILD